MAASIRNIQIEVQEVFRAVDHEIMLIKLFSNAQSKKDQDLVNYKNEVRNQNFANFLELNNDLDIADEKQPVKSSSNQKYHIFNNTSMDLLIESSN